MIALAALAAPVVVALIAGSPPATADAVRARRLTDLVRQDCGSCHGMTLKGGLGKALLPADLAHVDAAGLAAIILDGIPGTPMPPWRGQITADDARWIAEKLKQGFPQ